MFLLGFTYLHVWRHSQDLTEIKKTLLSEKDRFLWNFASLCMMESDQGVHIVVGKISLSRTSGKHSISILIMFSHVFTHLNSMNG